MRPLLWNPPIELSTKEEKVAKRTQSQIICVFCRYVTHYLTQNFKQNWQQFSKTVPGLCPVAPAQLALTIILQAYGVSDDEAMEAIEMDRRWQLVLDCLDCEQPLWERNTGKISCLLMSKSFDRRLIENNRDSTKTGEVTTHVR